MVAAEIHVCQVGSCRREGAEAVLLEIEELSKGLDCSVQSSGCLGACGQAPNAVVVKKRGSEAGDFYAQRGGKQTLHTRLDDVEKSAAVVREATGQAPSLDDPGLRQRLTAARQLRVRKQAKGETKWNLAMAGMAEQLVSTADPDDRLQLQFEHAILSRSAGAWEQALRSLVAVEEVVGAHPEVLLEKGKVLGKLGRLEELVALQQRARGASCGHRALSVLKACEVEAAKGEQPRQIEGYAQWRLEHITPVSKHSAVYHFKTSDRKRGTPYVRGRGRTMWHRTWHTTLLAEVGANGEGPLPWVERDYTPISTWIGARLLATLVVGHLLAATPVPLVRARAGAGARARARVGVGAGAGFGAGAALLQWPTPLTALCCTLADWDKGSCDILIKIYRDGTGTSWLQQQPLGSQVWLSQPMKTLAVPSLVLDSSRMSNSAIANHEGVLLVLAGTGIVAAAQVPQEGSRQVSV